jgi:SAM-dependent methyltransferase
MSNAFSDLFAAAKRALLGSATVDKRAVVDLGCGTGSDAALFHEAGFEHIVGIEESRVKAAKAKHCGATIICGDMRTSLDRVPWDNIGLITSFFSIECLKAKELHAFMQALERAALPDTMFMCVSIDGDAMRAFLDAFNGDVVLPAADFRWSESEDCVDVRFDSNFSVVYLHSALDWDAAIMSTRWTCAHNLPLWRVCSGVDEANVLAALFCVRVFKLKSM